MKTVMYALHYLCAIIVILVGIYAMFDGIWSTGPNCPGMDPQWLGFCEEVEE